MNKLDDIERLLNELREKWTTLSQTKCKGTVAVVDLSRSTKFKANYPTPEIWLERLSSFMETIRQVAEEVLQNPYIKYLGDGVLIFSKAKDNDPIKFLEFSENLANRIMILNSSQYKSNALTLQFTLALDYGSDIYLFHNGPS